MRKNIITTGTAAALVAGIILGAGCITTGKQSCCGTCDSDTACKAAAAKASCDTKAKCSTESKFVTSTDKDGRLWILRPGEEKAEKHITLVGAGPNKETIKALDKTTVIEFLAQKPGFATVLEDGRIWVFKAGEDTSEKPEKHITRVGAGPLGATIKAADKEVLAAYLAAK
jgi:hypothetical protein